MTNQKLTSLLQLAAEDLQLARERSTPARPAAYHLSQAAEKAARAVCEYEAFRSVRPTTSARSVRYSRPVTPCATPIEAQNYQSSASTKYRYPDPAGRLPQPPTADEIKRRVVDVEQFLAAVEKFVARSDDNDESSTLGRHR